MTQNKLRQQLWDCLAIEWTTATQTNLAQLSPEEWTHLYALAAGQGILPLLWQRLQSNGQQHLLPALLDARLQAAVYKATVRNLHLYHELGVLLACLREHNIKVIVLKGVHLAATVYPHPSLRSMNDIDLLFLPSAVPAAVEVLQALGYQPAAPIVWDKQLATEHHLPRFSKPGVVAGVEVHWTITRPNRAYTIAMTELWAQATPVTVAEVPVLGFCPEDLLLHLCEHATYQHQCLQGMRFLCDIDALVRHAAATIDWQRVQQQAQVRGWRQGVHLALSLAQQLLATPVPEPVLQQLQATGFDARLLEIAMDQCFADKRTAGTISHAFAQLAVTSSWGEKAKLVGRRLRLHAQIIAQEDEMARPAPQRYGYALTYYRNLLMRYSGKLWRLWCKDPAILGVTQSNLGLNDRKAELSQWLEQS